MAGLLDKVNRMEVSAELLREVLQMHAAMPPEDRPVFEARAFQIFELMKSKGVHSNRIAPFATAIDFRLTALARLEQGATLRGWSIPQQKRGVSWISFDALRAAAERMQRARQRLTPKPFASAFWRTSNRTGRHEPTSFHRFAHPAVVVAAGEPASGHGEPCLRAQRSAAIAGAKSVPMRSRDRYLTLSKKVRKIPVR